MSASLERIHEALAAAGWLEVSALPLLPPRNGPGLHYPQTMMIDGSESPWYVRSFGTDFRIAADSWRRISERWYSLGWALHGDREEPTVLLAQGWGDDPRRSPQVLELLNKRCVAVAEAVESRPSTKPLNRLAAVLNLEPLE